MERRGFPMRSWDPNFADDPTALADVYDFVTCSETIEHIAEPRPALERFGRLLRPGGVLGVMTQLRDATRPFESWWYRRDPTHVSLYSADTMRWIAADVGWRLDLPGNGVAIFTLPGP